MPPMTSLGQPSNVSQSLAELQAQLAEFRSTHPPRTKLPPSLWQSAAELARCQGLYRVAHSLQLDYNTLKKQVSGSAESRGGRKKKRAQPQFIELMGATRHSGDEYLIEFESARGGKLRIHCKTNTPPDWPVLLRAWRGA
jgi:hypothetical protein